MRLAWCTDLHLDHAKHRRGVIEGLADDLIKDSDSCVITGDIASQTEADLLGALAFMYGKPIYFVLGNHDFWGGSFEEGERFTRQLCAAHSNLTWLTESDPVEIATGVQLVGVDGWYDAHAGNWKSSSFEMVDWRAIRDFRPFRSGPRLVGYCRARAQYYAHKATVKLSRTTASRVFFATHVPPFEQSAMHEGKPSSDDALPWYTSCCLGDALSEFAEKRPEISLTTLCGHVHSSSEYQPSANHTVLCGAAEYGSPTIARVFEVT